MKKKLLFCLLGSALSVSAAHAELSVNGLLGVADYTTRIHGDSLHNHSGVGTRGYYQYPGAINTTNVAAGVLARYLYPVSCPFSIGLEGGYAYINIDYKKHRADHLVAGNPVFIESFKTESSGVALLNAVVSAQVMPDLSFSVFGGPAWLNTKYTDNDYYDGYKATSKNQYSITADAGVEGDWTFQENWAAGLRYDYIFNTDYRTISNYGSTSPIDGLPLNKKLTASSGTSVFSLTLRYVIPGF